MSARVAELFADIYGGWRRWREQQFAVGFSGDRWWERHRRQSYWRQIFVGADDQQQRNAFGHVVADSM